MAFLFKGEENEMDLFWIISGFVMLSLVGFGLQILAVRAQPVAQVKIAGPDSLRRSVEFLHL